MRGVHRAALIALIIGVAPALSGCADFDLDKLDVFGLNQKKKLPGERHAVFPEGVPGVTQGIPPEYMKGNEQGQLGAAVSLENTAPSATPAAADKKTAAIAPAEAKPKAKPRPKRTAARPKRPKAAQEEAQPASAQPPAQPPAQAAQPAPAAQPAAGWPPPANTSSSPWPAPVPSGTFSR